MMTEVTVQLSDETLRRLNAEAQRLNRPVDAVINTAIKYFLDDDEPTEDEILSGLRQAMIDVLEGNTRPADAFLAELKEEFGSDADER